MKLNTLVAATLVTGFMMTTPLDEFLSGVKVTIRNSASSVLLDVTSEGPYLLANLPAGKYQIEAGSEGMAKRQAVEIQAGRHQHTVFVWTARDESNKPIVSGAKE